jgi:hypothetical protein
MATNAAQLFTDLVNAVLAWEEADAIRSRIVDSKKATRAEVEAANARLMSSIQRLRTVAREIRRFSKLAPRKKKSAPLPWGKIIDVAAAALDVAKKAKDSSAIVAPVVQARVIDMK